MEKINLPKEKIKDELLPVGLASFRKLQGSVSEKVLMTTTAIGMLLSISSCGSKIISNSNLNSQNIPKIPISSDFYPKAPLQLSSFISGQDMDKIMLVVNPQYNLTVDNDTDSEKNNSELREKITTGFQNDSKITELEVEPDNKAKNEEIEKKEIIKEKAGIFTKETVDGQDYWVTEYKLADKNGEATGRFCRRAFGNYFWQFLEDSRGEGIKDAQKDFGFRKFYRLKISDQAFQERKSQLKILKEYSKSEKKVVIEENKKSLVVESSVQIKTKPKFPIIEVNGVSFERIEINQGVFYLSKVFHTAQKGEKMAEFCQNHFGNNMWKFLVNIQEKTFVRNPRTDLKEGVAFWQIIREDKFIKAFGVRAKVDEKEKLPERSLLNKDGDSKKDSNNDIEDKTKKSSLEVIKEEINTEKRVVVTDKEFKEKDYQAKILGVTDLNGISFVEVKISKGIFFVSKNPVVAQDGNLSPLQFTIDSFGNPFSQLLVDGDNSTIVSKTVESLRLGGCYYQILPENCFKALHIKIEQELKGLDEKVTTISMKKEKEKYTKQDLEKRILLEKSLDKEIVDTLKMAKNENKLTKLVDQFYDKLVIELANLKNKYLKKINQVDSKKLLKQFVEDTTNARILILREQYSTLTGKELLMKIPELFYFPAKGGAIIKKIVVRKDPKTGKSKSVTQVIKRVSLKSKKLSKSLWLVPGNIEKIGDPEQYEEMIDNNVSLAVVKYKVDAKKLRETMDKIIWRESRFNSWSVSPTYCLSLLQYFTGRAIGWLHSFLTLVKDGEIKTKEDLMELTNIKDKIINPFNTEEIIRSGCFSLAESYTIVWSWDKVIASHNVWISAVQNKGIWVGTLGRKFLDDVNNDYLEFEEKYRKENQFYNFKIDKENDKNWEELKQERGKAT